MRFFCFFLWVTFPFSVAAQLAVDGRADLSGYNLETDRPFSLAGTWDFYWNQLLSPEDLRRESKASRIYVPGSWHRQGNYSVRGYATYRLQLILPKEQSSLSLYIPIINSSASTWINGELIEQTGTASADPKQYKPKLSATIISIPEHVENIDIVIQVANDSYFSGGIAGVPLLDKSSAVFAKINRANGIENFFAGSLIAMFIYQLILYFLYHRGKPYLWLALICLGVALRALITHRGSFLLPNLFPSLEWEFWKKIEFGSVYLIVALFPLYVYHLFPNQAPRKPIVLFVVIAVGLTIAVMVTPQYIYGHLLEICHIALLFGFIYAVYSVIQAWKAGNEDARIILFGVLASFPFILAEILKNSLLLSLSIDFSYLVEIGVLVFLCFQVYLLANHYAKSYHNLETLNLNLEKIVAERTGELKTANSVKDRLLSVISHDIRSPLNSLRGILQIYNQGAISKGEFESFTRHIENDLGKTSMLVDNILYWTASQLKGVHVRMEVFDLYQLIEENAGLFQTIAQGKKVTLTHTVPKLQMVKSDRNILNLVLRNLISNAIKFSFEGGRITIRSETCAQSLIIQVSDEGVGMDDSTVEALFVSEGTMSSTGTENEKGTGLGLALCRNYLKQAGGELTAKSEAGKGSTFTIKLELNGQ